MVREAIARSGVRFEPTINLGSVLTLVGMIAAGIAFVYKIGGDVQANAIREDFLAQRVAAIEAQHGRAAIDHDAILSIQGDIKALRASIERRTRLEQDRMFDPNPTASDKVRPNGG